MDMDADSLGQWLVASADGDTEAFGDLAAAMQDALYRLALAGGLPATDASDAVQETFARAWKQRRTFQAGRSASAWLCGICLNVVREMRRKRKRNVFLIDIDGLANSSQAETSNEQRDELARLAEQLQHLPDRQREVLTCRYLRDMSVAATAEAMAISEGTVKAATAAALENLRTRMRMGNES